jgi:nicotinamidase-related amidase
MADLSQKLVAVNSVLLLVDIQQKLCAAMPEGVAKKVVETASALLEAANALSIPVLVTEQYPKGLGETIAELSSQLTAQSASVEKTCFSCMQADGFADKLAQTQRQQVVLLGMETHVCILQTALDLQAAGYQVFVVENGVSSRSSSNHQNAVDRMRQAGVIISNKESTMFEWLGDARHPVFKQLAKLIK